LVNKDSEKTREKVINKEFGWMDKMKIQDEKTGELKKMIDSLHPSQKDLFEKKEEREERILNKELRKL
jgi:hypothetical protein